MKETNHKCTKAVGVFTLLFLTVILLPLFALSQETYRFERMWPVYQQSWHFYSPFGIALDGSGNIYVADTGNHRIQKLSPDGQFITSWGRKGSEDGEFFLPRGVAVDNNGNVYVLDSRNYRIQKFASDGKFEKKMGEWSVSRSLRYSN